jgi:CheY-like chemotaxis protein
VIDDGEGIDSDFLPEIFGRFRQANSSKNRAHGGLGLGLAIVRELVQAHGGNISAQSPGKRQGSTFTVTLPIPAVIPAHIDVALQTAEANQPSVSGLHILVVDDDADAREVVALVLQSRGALTRLASSAAEAIDCIQGQRPDVMIADIGMPHEDGYVLIQKLRAHERKYSQRPLSTIALTAYASAVDREQALAAGYDLHLAKPVGATQLADAVANFRNNRITQ